MNAVRRSFRRSAWLCVAVLVMSACGGGHGGSVPAPGTSATPVGVLPSAQPTAVSSPTSTPATNTAAYTCPTSDAASATTSTGRRTSGEGRRRVAPRRVAAAQRSTAGAQLVAVTYDARSATTQRTTLGAREAALGATLTRSYTFSHANLETRILSVPASRTAGVMAALRTQSGVRSVSLTGNRRYPTSVSAPYFTNDPYFTGFASPIAQMTGGAVPAPTFKVLPLVQSAEVPGQWDMHVTRLEYAFAYSQANNGSGVVATAAALGSASVKIAVIDTGQDTSHPELTSKVAYQHCFITNPSNVLSTSAFTTDEDGHGTDVAGIAGEAMNNGLGFTGAGGNVKLYAYRVFPTPNDSCASTTSNDAQCGTDTRDIASAIQDAVNNHVNVISLSLGGDACSGGQDSDSTEGAAIADAIAANIIVVAAAGNGSGPPLESPACDPGVIAVGATALADGAANASGKAGGSPTAPVEYVASYSDSGTPGAAPGSASAWGIVAPGGDPSDSNDTDDLHWIDNIWTSTPFGGSTGDTNFAGDCKGDYPSQTGTADCRVFIAGTSMATPHVAGAAALIISVNPTYQNPALMKQLLCTTAADIVDPSEGCGRLDVYRAMATALHDPNIPATSPVP